MDPEAYHCPTCRSFFCFHCRARLLEPDTRLQCVNQGCDYYGKLVCGICDPLHEKNEAPSIYAEPEDGYWPAWLILVLIGTYLVGGYLLHRLGLNIFGRHRTLEHPRKSTFHTCIHCQSEVKELHKSARSGGVENV